MITAFLGCRVFITVGSSSNSRLACQWGIVPGHCSRWLALSSTLQTAIYAVNAHVLTGLDDTPAVKRVIISNSIIGEGSRDL